MKEKKGYIKITEEEYSEYLKRMAEMEQLIRAARASYERIARMKMHQRNDKFSTAYVLSLSKIKYKNAKLLEKLTEKS